MERSVTQGLVRDRVRFIRLLKQDSSLSIPAAAEKAGGYKKSWGYSIWKLYEQKGIAAVSLYPFTGTQPRLGKEDEQKLLAALKDDTVYTLHQAALLIKEITGVSYCDSAVWFIFKRLGIKKKTGRPSNVRKDVEGAENFKKKHRH